MLEKVGAKVTGIKNDLKNKIKNENKDSFEKRQTKVILMGAAALGLLDATESYSNTKILLSDKFEAAKNIKKTGAKDEIKNAKKELKRLNHQALKSGMFGAIKGMGSFILVGALLYFLFNKAGKQNEQLTKQVEPSDSEAQQTSQPAEEKQTSSLTEAEQIKNLGKI